jgi:exonuclease III
VEAVAPLGYEVAHHCQGRLERAALAVLRCHCLTDVIPRTAKGPHPFTYWEYRAGAFHKDMGKRIDLVFANGACTGLVKDAWIDSERAKGQAPSDPGPVIVDLSPSRGAGPNRAADDHAVVVARTARAA